MLSSLTIDDQTGAAVTLHETTKRAVVSASGLVGVSAPRRSVRVRPTGHGAIDETRYVDEALVTIVGDVWDTTQQGAYTEFRAIVAPMLATLDGQAALLKWTEGASGLALQRLVKLASGIEPTLSEAGALLRYQAVLAAADPRAYTQTLTSVVGSVYAAGVSTASVNNTGNRRSAAVIAKCFANGVNIVNPVVFGGTPAAVSVIGTVPGNSYLEIDMSARTLTMVVVATGVRTARMDMLDPAGTTWWQLLPGLSSPQMTATSATGAQLVVDYRSAYA